MSTMTPALQFASADLLGKVSSVDTIRVSIESSNNTLLTKTGIGSLLAIQGATKAEYLIALAERVTRSMREELSEVDAQGEHAEFTVGPYDLLRAVMIGTYRSVEGDKLDTFKRGADNFPQIDRDCYVVEGANLQRFMGILGAGLSEHERLKLGVFVVDRSAEAVASGDKFFQRHAAILGSTGSGKSWAVALVLERASKLVAANIIVFDMHGEYAPLAKSNGGFASRFKIAGPGDIGSTSEGLIFLPYWLLNREEMLSMILDRSDQNAPNQASRFTSHVRELKEKTLQEEHLEHTLETFTVDSPIPCQIEDLLKLLIKDNTDKGIGARGSPVKGDWEDKLTRFISRLTARREDRRYGFMFSPPACAQEYDWLADQVVDLLSAGDTPGIKIVDFSEVPADVLPVVTGTFARLLYDVQFWTSGDKRTPVALLCDEAHLYLPVRDDADAVQKQALSTFERIAKEGRKYGFSLIVVSQRPSDVSRTILSQCNNFLALRLTNETDQAVIRRLMPDSLAGITGVLPLLDTGEALLLGDAVLLPTRIKLDRPAIAPDSATRDFWKEWGTRKTDASAIKSAVECLRSQTRKRLPLVRDGP